MEKKNNMLSSINFSQEETIKNILKLHCKGNKIDADITYSKGQFYKNAIVEQPTHKFDKYPQTKDTVQITNKIPLPDKSINVLMFDPPFVISKGPSLQIRKKGSNIINNRFSCYENPSALFSSYALWMKEGYRVLTDGGIMIFKNQDTVSSGKNYFTHIYIFNEAINIGFYPKDLAVLLSKHRLKSSKHNVQQHLRKYHSYFWVLTKEKNKIDWSKYLDPWGGL